MILKFILIINIELNELMSGDKQWVADSLHQLIGMSEDTTVSYLISLARQASSVGKLKQTLLGEDWLPPDNPKSEGFIERLFTEFAVKKQPQVQTMAAKPQSDLEKIRELQKLSNYKMLNDEDIIGKDEEEEDENITNQVQNNDVPDKWKKLEADLKRIREREAQRDEIASLRQTMEETGGKEATSLLSKREQKQMKKAFKELDKLERDNFVADLQKKDKEKTE